MCDIDTQLDPQLLSWWPSLANARCTEPLSQWGFRISRDLYQMTTADEVSSEALSALVSACDLITSPTADYTESIRRIMKQKCRILSLLRKRLETNQPISDQIVMTMFFLLTLDVRGSFQAPQ